MPKPTAVKGGGAYPPDIAVKVPEGMQRREPLGKAKCILQAAVLRKRGKALEGIENRIGIPEGTVHGWPARLATGGPECRHGKSPGGPPRLNREQQDATDADTSRRRRAALSAATGRPGWRSGACRTGSTYHAPMTGRRSRPTGWDSPSENPAPHRTAAPYPKSKREFIENAKAATARRGEEGSHVVIDAATIRDPPSSKRGLRRRGGRDAAGVNYSRRSTNILGAPGSGALHMEYRDNLKADR